MCGRFDLSRSAEEVLQTFRALGEAAWPARYNIAPGQDIPLVHVDAAGRRVLAPAYWGFRPHFAEGREDAPAPINARAEKVAESGYFREAFARRRGIVPADGWFEWRSEAGARQPYRFHRRDGGLLGLAAIWTSAADVPSGRRLAIITEPARGVARAVHPRMPVVLAPECWEAWLDPDLQDRAALRAAVTALPTEALIAHPVSRRVGNPRNDDAALVAPEGEPLPDSAAN